MPLAISGPIFLERAQNRLLPRSRRLPISLAFALLSASGTLRAAPPEEAAIAETTTPTIATSAASATVSAASGTNPALLDQTELKRFVETYWQQRFTEHAERVNWRDYHWQIDTVIPEAAAKLPPCRQTYQVEASFANLPVGRQRLRLRCPDKPGWTITTSSQISVLMPVVTTRTALAPEHYLQASDVVLTQILLTAHQSDVLIDPAQAIGRRPLRALRPGQPVRNKMLEAALLVRKGDKVRLTMIEGEMSISMEGIALQDGQKGEIISIKNTRGGSIISAQVSGPGQLLRLDHSPTLTAP